MHRKTTVKIARDADGEIYVTPKDCIRMLLEIFDEGKGIIDPEVMANTPERVSRMYTSELLSGYKTDPQAILRRTFKSTHNEMIIVGGIDFSSLCEHHMLPFRGKAYIGYIPNGCILGLSKFARLVNCMSQRLQLQERLISEIADAIMVGINPLGVGVVIDAEHECMSIRGVNKPGTKTTMSAMRGVFEEGPTMERFMRLIRMNGGGH